MSSQTNPAADRWPPQVRFILGNEAAERFSYYGMKGILALYITNVLMMTKDDATSIIHLFGFANYFMPLLGAWVSDRYWGRYHTILWISLSYCAGHGVMALSDVIPTVDGKAMALYVGLGLIAFGSGGIKPCVSAFMGDQFRADQKHLLQKAYAAFYWAINFGSTASFFAIPWIRKEYGYGWAFGVPGLAMGVATFVFWLGTKHYVMVPPARKTKAAGFIRVFAYAFSNQICSQSNLSFWDVARVRFSDAEVDAAKSVLPILSIFALVPIFFSLFDQTFSTWVLQGEKMKSYFTASSPVFSNGDLKNFDSLRAKLAARTNAPSDYLWGQLSDEGRRALTDSSGSKANEQVLVQDLNRIIGAYSVLDTNRFAGVKFGADAIFFLSLSNAPPEEITRLNRLLLEDSFPAEIAKSYRIGPEEMLSVNPILVMILLPIMTLGLYPLLGRLATPLRRMSFGMFLAGLSFVVVAMIQTRIDAGEKLSVLWQIVP